MHTIRDRINLCRIPMIAVFLVVLSGNASSQVAPVIVDNSEYSYGIQRIDGSEVFVITGYAPTRTEAVRLPTRIVRIPATDLSPVPYQIAAVEYGAGFSASPWYYVENLSLGDTAVSSVVKPLPPSLVPVTATDARIISQRLVRGPRSAELEIEVPLLVHNPATGETRWIERMELRPDRSQPFAARGIPEVTQGQYYSELSIMRWPNDLDTSGAWMNFSGRMIRFSVARDGIFKLTKNWFTGSGIDIGGVDSRNVKLYRKGVEIPMAEQGMDDGSIDDGDWFIFYGERNYPPGTHRRAITGPSSDEPYPEYLSRYCDSTAYWLVVDSKPARRMASLPAMTASGDTINWYYHNQHVEYDNWLQPFDRYAERKENPLWTSMDTWAWSPWGDNGTMRVNVSVDNLRPGLPSRVWCKYLSDVGDPVNLQNNHRVVLWVNTSAPFDSLTSNGAEQALAYGLAPAGDVIEGQNTVYMLSRKIMAARGQLAFDWMEMEYPRNAVAVSNSLALTVDSIMGQGIRPFEMRGFDSNELFIIRKSATDFRRVEQFITEQGQTWRVVFADTAQPGTRYIATLIQNISEPGIGREVTSENLRTPGKEAEYLIVTTKEFQSECQAYASFIEQSYGFSTRIVLTEDLYNNFGYGIFNPEALKLFLYDAYRTWNTRPLRSVFLVGDANLNYRFTDSRAPYLRNLVPSYGAPVSDTWYVCFDSADTKASFTVGRLPARTPEDIAWYHEKHRSYLAQKPDAWNKTTMHFSGGDGAKESDLIVYRLAHKLAIDSVFLPGAFAGNPTHFYKTVEPRTNFGPITLENFNSIIREGGIIISYLGHSGTETWDNSIDDPKELENGVSRFPLVSDFGCSTGRFAEPDIRCFAEQFVTPNQSQAIGYLGNSSLGFTSTSFTMPGEFYSKLLRQNLPVVGQAHRAAKQNLIDKYGANAVNRIFVLTNTLVGDPVVRVPVPEKPNLHLSDAWIRSGTEIITSAMDSLRFVIPVGNYGLQYADSVTLRVEDFQGTTRLHGTEVRIRIPGYIDTVRLTIPSGNLSGERFLNIQIDPDNRIEEMDENDNAASYGYFVLDASLSVMNNSLSRTTDGLTDVRILNPLLSPGPVSQVVFEFSDTFEFASPTVLREPYGRAVSSFTGNQPLSGAGRKYWRAALDIPGVKYLGPYSYRIAPRSAQFVQMDSIDFMSSEQVNIQPLNGAYTLNTAGVNIHVISAGAKDGTYGAVERNGINILPFTFYSGYQVAVFDSATMKLIETRYFSTYDTAPDADSLKVYLRGIGFGRIIAVATADEPRRRTAVFDSALYEFGSDKIDSVKLGPVWPSFSMIGRRGLARGLAIEAYREPFKGRAVVDTTFAAPLDTGWIVSPSIGPASRWRSARFSWSRGPIRFDILARDSSGMDSVLISVMDADSIDLSMIDAERYPFIRLRAVLIPTGLDEPPVFQAWSADFRQYPELALNYQTVSIGVDSVKQDSDVPISIGIVNPGDAPAKSFTVNVDRVGEDNITRPMANYTVAGLGVNAWHDTTFTIRSGSLRGYQRVYVHVDREGAITEQVETNNLFQTGFYVLKDTTRPILRILLDGAVPMDGDYIRRAPEIVLSIQSSLPIPDLSTRNFRIMLDKEDIGPSDTLVRTFNPQTGELTYRPYLYAGEHTFEFNAEDAYGNLAYDDWYPVTVIVDTVSSVSRIFNYPNPFQEQTTFTFLLTGQSLPQRVELKFYTVSGRMIRRVTMRSEDIRLGYNTWRWDGRDEDGDALGNGVYFYKFISTIDGQSTETIGKIAVLR